MYKLTECDEDITPAKAIGKGFFKGTMVISVLASLIGGMMHTGDNIVAVSKLTEKIKQIELLVQDRVNKNNPELLAQLTDLQWSLAQANINVTMDMMIALFIGLGAGAIVGYGVKKLSQSIVEKVEQLLR